MKKTTITLTLTALFLLCSMQAQAIPTSYGTANHYTPAWQELATYDNGTMTSDYGVFWSVDNGATWGQDTNLFVGQQVKFKFNMHKRNVGTHYADFLKSWIDWGRDGSFNDADVVAYGYQELTTNEGENIGSWNTPNQPDYTFYSDTFLLTEDNIGDLWLRARVTCSDSLAQSMGGYGSWDDQWTIPAETYKSGFNPTGFLYQGESEEWGIKVNAAPVPEPATMFLLGSGLLGMIGFRRKKK